MKTEGLKRITYVTNVLVRQGLGYFVQELGLKWHLPIFKQFVTAKKIEPMPERIRKALEQLGGAYVKLGQLLSLRPDLVPDEYCVEFRKLLDEMHPMPYDEVQKIVEQELKRPLHEVFLEFDKKPIGSASIAQVHVARLKNGKKVAVKVQRPNARKEFESDIDIMYYVARKIEKRFAEKTISPTTIVQEFEKYTHEELDFFNEAKNIDDFYKNFEKSKKVVVPKLYWQYSTSKILTMEYVHGTKLSELKNRVNKKHLAKIIADAMFDQVFNYDVFHADLHPGNILLLSDGRIALLDFGIVSRLGPELRQKGIDVYVALINKDVQAITKTLLKVGTPSPETDMNSFLATTQKIVDEWHGRELGQVKVTHMLHKLFSNCVTHKIKMPVSLIMLGKALVTLEGTCLYLDPEFNFVEYSMPKVERMMRKQKSPSALIKRFTKRAGELSSIMSQLPEETLALVEKLKTGKIEFEMHDTDVKHLGSDINKSSNRLAYALLIAALLVSGAMLISVKPLYNGYSIFTILAVLASVLLMLTLVISLFKEGSPRYDPHREK